MYLIFLQAYALSEDLYQRYFALFFPKENKLYFKFFMQRFYLAYCPCSKPDSWPLIWCQTNIIIFQQAWKFEGRLHGIFCIFFSPKRTIQAC